jgi:hypothetical protein
MARGHPSAGMSFMTNTFAQAFSSGLDTPCVETGISLIEWRRLTLLFPSLIMVQVHPESRLRMSEGGFKLYYETR